MGIRHRAVTIDRLQATSVEGLEHLPPGSADVLRWLVANRVEFVLVGAVARAIRGEGQAAGPVAIVPAPYRRNIDRLVRACAAAHARGRAGSGPLEGAGAETVPVRLKAATLLDAGRWRLRVGGHDLDIEGRPRDAPVYQELLYEAERITLAPQLELEVASIEGIAVYDHIARTGVMPEIRVIRRMTATDGSPGVADDGAAVEPSLEGEGGQAVEQIRDGGEPDAGGEPSLGGGERDAGSEPSLGGGEPDAGSEPLLGGGEPAADAEREPGIDQALGGGRAAGTAPEAASLVDPEARA